MPRAALQDDWDGLRAQKGGTWLENLVEEYDVVVARARKEGKTIHLGRLFEIAVIKHDELPEEKKKDKGRIVFQGNNVKD